MPAFSCCSCCCIALSFRRLSGSNFMAAVGADENITTSDLIRFYFVRRPASTDRLRGCVRRPSCQWRMRIETAPSDPAPARWLPVSKSDPERETGIATFVRVSNNEGKLSTARNARGLNYRSAGLGRRMQPAGATYSNRPLQQWIRLLNNLAIFFLFCKLLSVSMSANVKGCGIFQLCGE